MKVLKIWWEHRVFNFKYPVRFTEQEKWLIEYGKYLKKLDRLRTPTKQTTKPSKPIL